MLNSLVLDMLWHYRLTNHDSFVYLRYVKGTARHLRGGAITRVKVDVTKASSKA